MPHLLTISALIDIRSLYGALVLFAQVATRFVKYRMQMD